MVDTLQLYYRISNRQIDNFLQVASLNPKTKYSLQNYRSGRKKFANIIPSSNIYGLQKIFVVKGFFPAENYLYITIRPEDLITGIYTNELFKCNQENIKLLATTFNILLPEILKTDAIKFEDAKLRRIDYAMNLHADDVELTLKLLKASYYDPNKNDGQYHKCNGNRNYNIYASSFSSKQKTVSNHGTKRFTIYSKEEKLEYITNTYPDKYTTAELDSLLNSAQNLLRYEVQLRKIHPKAFFKKYGVEDYEKTGIFAYLSENIATAILYNEYSKSIGYACWYSEYYASKILKNALANKTITSHQFKTMQKMMEAISRCRSIIEARMRYTSPNGIILGHANVIKGSSSTWNKYMKLFKVLNLQSLRIPKRDCICGLTRVQNPLAKPMNTTNHATMISTYEK